MPFQKQLRVTFFESFTYRICTGFCFKELQPFKAFSSRSDDSTCRRKGLLCGSCVYDKTSQVVTISYIKFSNLKSTRRYSVRVLPHILKIITIKSNAVCTPPFENSNSVLKNLQYTNYVRVRPFYID